MPARQLRLFPAPQPLVDRLGPRWFRSVPAEPGVYRMFDAQGRLLYIGRSGNLRNRLGSYRRTHGQPRRTVRLLHAAVRIEYEILPSPMTAVREEARLLRTLRPPFNRAGTWPDSARGVAWIPSADGEWVLAVGDSRQPGTYGPFRGSVAPAMGTLAAFLWLAGRGIADPARLPPQFRVGRQWRLDPSTAAGRHADAIHAWLAGEPTGIIGVLVAEMGPTPNAFAAAWRTDAEERLQQFHARWPMRIRALRQARPDLPATLEPALADDLLADLMTPATGTSGSSPPEAGSGIGTRSDPRTKRAAC